LGGTYGLNVQTMPAADLLAVRLVPCAGNTADRTSEAVFASIHHLGILGGAKVQANADLGFVDENVRGLTALASILAAGMVSDPSHARRAIPGPVKPSKGDPWGRVRKADRAIAGYSIS
jgi:hypothetical protein